MSVATLAPPATPVVPAAQPAASPSAPPPPAVPSLPLYFDRLYRYTVDQYHAMVEAGVITNEPKCELLDGLLVLKMPMNPPHGGGVKALIRVIPPRLPAGWELSVQAPVSLAESVPEPDGAVVRADPGEYFTRHPGPGDFGVVIEVADTSRLTDRRDKGRTYARAGLPVYWIVNLVEGQVEVYTDPQPAADPPGYASRADYKPGDAVPLTLDGATVAVPVADLLP